jgi:PAS domain-containing protein
MAAVMTCTLMIDRFVRDEAGHEATLLLQTHADSLRDALDRGMAQNYEPVRVLGQLDQVAASADPAVARRALDQMHASFTQYAWLGLAGRDGKVIASTHGLLQGRERVGTVVVRGRAARRVRRRRAQRAAAREAAARARRAVALRRHRHAGLFGRRQLARRAGAHLSWSWAAEIKHDLVDIALAQHQAQALIVGTDGTLLLGSAELQGRMLAPAQAGRRMLLGVLHKSGAEIPVGLSAAALRTETGEVAYAFLHDVCARLRAERLLAKRERRLRTITDNMPALVSHIDRCASTGARCTT